MTQTHSAYHSPSQNISTNISSIKKRLLTSEGKTNVGSWIIAAWFFSTIVFISTFSDFLRLCVDSQSTKTLLRETNNVFLDQRLN